MKGHGKRRCRTYIADTIVEESVDRKDIDSPVDDNEHTTNDTSPIKFVSPPLADESDIDFLSVYLRDRWSQVSSQLLGKDADQLYIDSKKKWFEMTFKNEQMPDESLLCKPVYVYTLDQLDKLKTDNKSQVVVLKDFMNKWNMNNSLFSLDHIERKYGEYETDIRIQDPMIEGFNMKSKRYSQEVEYMLVKDYVKYQRSKKSMNIHDASSLDNHIKFAVNLDIGNFKDQMLELYRKVPSWLFCNQQDDIQGYLRKHIPGMSVPQIYLKVAGCWTGGHQENLALRAVNINHGPGEVEWYCMEVDEAYRFNQFIQVERKVNLLKLEGLWYLSLKDVISRGFKVSKFIQEEGDVVVLAPGTLHWVRSYSYTVNSAWNIGYYDQNQVEEIFRRFDFNNKYGFVNLIPVRTLCLDLINNESHRFDEVSYNLLKNHLFNFLEDSKKILHEIDEKMMNIEYENKDVNNIVMCSACRGETFETWFYDSGLGDEFDSDLIRCATCFLKNKRVDKTGKISHGICFIKYSTKDINQFMKEINALSYSDIKKKKSLIYLKWVASRYYCKNSISEYFRVEDNEMKDIESDTNLFEDPVQILKEKNFLSRKTGVFSSNIFDKDMLSYKIKKKSNASIDEIPETKSEERSLNEMKIDSRMEDKSKGQEEKGYRAKKEKVLECVYSFSERYTEYDICNDETMLKNTYNEYEEKKVSAAGLTVIRLQLIEDKFEEMSEEDKLYCLFIYFDNLHNADETRFFTVNDDDIKDKNLVSKLKSIV